MSRQLNNEISLEISIFGPPILINQFLQKYGHSMKSANDNVTLGPEQSALKKANPAVTISQLSYNTFMSFQSPSNRAPNKLLTPANACLIFLPNATSAQEFLAIAKQETNLPAEAIKIIPYPWQVENDWVWSNYPTLDQDIETIAYRNALQNKAEKMHHHILQEEQYETRRLHNLYQMQYSAAFQKFAKTAQMPKSSFTGSYNKVQFISAVTETDLSSMKQKYIGHNDETCLSAQLDFFNSILLSDLCKSQTIDFSPGTLKVVTLPEGFFRPTSAQEAYPLEYVSYICNEIRKLVSNSAYKDYWFVLGTIVAYIPRETNTTIPPAPAHIDSKPIVHSNKLCLYEIFNVSVLMKGGESQPTNQNTVIVYKEYMADCEFSIPRTKLAAIEGSTDCDSIRLTMPKNHEDEFNDDFKKTYGTLEGRSFFSMDKINCGLEICLDHLRGRLRNAYFFHDEIFRISIQLLISCGIEVDKSNVIVNPKGLVHLNDGNRIFARSELYVKSETGLNSILPTETLSIGTAATRIDIYSPQDLVT